ncbi:DUF3618 domain-containing protein [Actinomycetospora rhizophila]|uniref:DUF3618 domain-containing protein n=1 Tax=Actinomycetospora rhizophila TaxID=1416876 RepID=A0ABV9ZML5_9PSEU|nr:DUF3618 domain-containing protein [Actinomycetospora lutea]MDD7937898.1 DUF3618 domain-containing protein [Actinomycetospora lutea]
MARDTDAIEKEIQQAREALAGALDELSERANPQRLSEQGKEMAAQKWADPRVKYAVYAAGALVGLIILRKLFR